MDAFLAVRSLVQRGGMQVLIVGSGDDLVNKAEPALAMRTWDDGGVCIVPAHVMCVCSGPDPRERFGLIIEAAAMRQIADRAGVTAPTIDARYKDGLVDPALRHVLDTLEAELARGGLATSLYIDVLLAQLIVCVFRAFDTHAELPVELPVVAPVPVDGRLARVLHYIDEHLDAQISTDDIARVIDLSPFHFSRAFKRWTGESPHQFLLRRRLERAHELLVASQMPLAQVATSVGFYDQSHLGHHFKRRFGATPREMRERKNVRAR